MKIDAERKFSFLFFNDQIKTYFILKYIFTSNYLKVTKTIRKRYLNSYNIFLVHVFLTEVDYTFYTFKLFNYITSPLIQIRQKKNSPTKKLKFKSVNTKYEPNISIQGLECH